MLNTQLFTNARADHEGGGKSIGLNRQCSDSRRLRGASKPTRALSIRRFAVSRQRRHSNSNFQAFVGLKTRLADCAGRNGRRTSDVWLRMKEFMRGLRTNLWKFAATLVICTLTIASVAASICPACSKVELPSAKDVAFNATDNDRSPDCDKDGCSCCGFQIAPTPVAPSFWLAASASAPANAAPRRLMGSVFPLYRPPRS